MTHISYAPYIRGSINGRPMGRPARSAQSSPGPLPGPVKASSSIGFADGAELRGIAASPASIAEDLEYCGRGHAALFYSATLTLVVVPLASAAALLLSW